MAANRKFRFGPIALTATPTTNVLNPPTASGGVNAGASAQYILLYWLKAFNKTGAPATFSLWLGATGANAAGTEVVTTKSVPANDSVDIYFPSGLRIDATDFLVGGASALTTITLTGGGEIGVSG